MTLFGEFMLVRASRDIKKSEELYTLYAYPFDLLSSRQETLMKAH
jgi:hypothetical protein